MQRYKLVFFTPRPSTQSVLQHLFTRFPNNVGRIGAYGGCAFVSPGTGQFLPLEGANPTIGAVGTPEHVEEDRVEVLLTSQNEDGVEMGAVLQELKKVHPYEEVAYDVYRLEDF
ncbi:GTP cyclohydrolase 1 type 2/Nif3 [Fomes fomentarius]|nr:GTP cyclohydrolase 1 type 2/Nif3 [Fomes fomentarius]